MDHIPFSLPDISEIEKKLVLECLDSGWLTTGPKTKLFEQEVLKFLKGFYEKPEAEDHLKNLDAMAVNSATSGLHLALEAIGVTKGDRVIIPSFTFTASAEVVRYLGADPLFCDVLFDSQLMDPNSVEKLLKADTQKKIKAIMPVHYGGQACDLYALKALAEKYQVFIIEDAAHAFGTTYQKRPIGTIGGDICVYSFYANKNLCCGEGGMVITSRVDFAKRIKTMRLHGIDRDVWQRFNSNTPKWYYEIVAPGYKYNLPDMAGALGVAQLSRHEEMLNKRINIAQFYLEKFKDLEPNFIHLPKVRDLKDIHSYHLFPIVLQSKENNSTLRNHFISWMSEQQINCSVHYIPLHQQPYWKKTYQLQDEDFPVSTMLGNNLVSLPIYSKLTLEQAQRVVAKTVEYFNTQF